MLLTTRYYNFENICYTKQNGLPRKVGSFKLRSEGAVRIEIMQFVGNRMSKKIFYKSEDGRWLGGYRVAGDGNYYREELAAKKTLMHIVSRQISKLEYDSLIEGDVARAMDVARQSLLWCKAEDEDDPDGRYWLSAYAGCGPYQLVVQSGRIIASLPGGYHDSCPLGFNKEAWRRAVVAAIDERVDGDYQMMTADGSGCHFYLRNSEDAKYLKVREYEVPSVHGGYVHNIEIMP